MKKDIETYPRYRAYFTSELWSPFRRILPQTDIDRRQIQQTASARPACPIKEVSCRSRCLRSMSIVSCFSVVPPRRVALPPVSTFLCRRGPRSLSLRATPLQQKKLGILAKTRAHRATEPVLPAASFFSFSSLYPLRLFFTFSLYL